MKKLIAIIASIALACMLAFTVTSCQSNEDKAISLTEKMIKAAKNDNVKEFVKLAKEVEELNKKLSDEETEAIEKKLKDKVTAEDQQALMQFMMKHGSELKDINF